jgi:citrate synthase
MAWITAAEALAALGIRPQTLYANVSRGRIRARPDPKDSRRSLYNSDDVKRLAGRRAGRRTVAAVAAETIGWGDPVLPSSISTVLHGRLWYRGRDVVELSETSKLEEIAGLLWEGDELSFGHGQNVPAATWERDLSPLQAALLVLSARAGTDPPVRGRSRSVLAAEAAGLIDAIASVMIRSTTGTGATLHSRMATAWGAPRAGDILRRAAVLLADHELNASTFAARVTASTGAPLAAGLLAGLATLTGPLHGGVSAAIYTLIESARGAGAKGAVRRWLALGNPMPGFGHPLYPDGDPRATALFAHFRPPPIHAELCAAVESLTGEQPNVDFAMAAVADSFGLPQTAPFTTFAIARSVGWAAHILEQAAAGSLIRPRARYVGPPIELKIEPA